MMPASRRVDSMDFAKGVAVCAGGVCTVLGVTDAHAGYGAYTSGQGVRSSAAGGIVYALVQDSTTLSANPALARQLGPRIDGLIEYNSASSHVDVNGNLLGQNDDYKSSQRDFVFPQAGFVVPLTEQLSVGMTGFVAGFGSRYKPNPFQRFGAEERVTLALNQVGLSTALAYELAPDQTLGLSLNLSYDAIEITGVQSLALFSETPQRFSDQGRSGVFGVGFSVGWYGRLTPWLTAGAGYRTQTWGQGRFEEYEGLFPEQGTVEFPAIFGGGFAVTPVNGWTVAVEIQRVPYSDQPAFGNPLSQIERNRFGSDDGPGFGWKDQTIGRVAVIYTPNLQWTLRLGYSRGTQQMARSETLFGTLGPDTSIQHYACGVSWDNDRGWEFSGAFVYSPSSTVRGKDSIPTLAGGGEVDVGMHAVTAAFAVTRHFDF